MPVVKKNCQSKLFRLALYFIENDIIRGANESLREVNGN